MSTTTFSLEVLYDQYKHFMNTWSYPNNQLNLAKYKNYKFNFYKHQDTNYIVQYNTVPPMQIDKYTSPNTHPAFLMQAKKKIIVYSFKTRPGGRKKITVRVAPPKLFKNNWYSQHNLCKVHLVS